MSHRRSRYRIAACGIVLLCTTAAPAQAEPVIPPPTPAAANAGAMDAADRLTELARQMAAPQSAAPSPEAAERERRPLGAAAASGTQLTTPPSDAVGSGTLGALGALGLVLGLILVLRWGWVRFGGAVVARSSPAVEVLSRTTVSPRNHVVLLRVGGRIVVVGDSSAGLRTLAQIEEPDEVAGLLEAVTAAKTTSISQTFSQLLSHKGGEFGDSLDAPADPEHRVDRARDSLSGLLTRVRTLSQQKGGTN